jgi:hypothetical protein
MIRPPLTSIVEPVIQDGASLAKNILRSACTFEGMATGDLIAHFLRHGFAFKNCTWSQSVNPHSVFRYLESALPRKHQ